MKTLSPTFTYIHLIPQVEKENTVDTSNSQQQRTYDADSLELQLDHGKRKNHYTKNKSSNKQPSSESGQEKMRYDLRLLYIASPLNYLCRPETGRRNSNVTVKSRDEKFTETEITWSENTDRLI